MATATTITRYTPSQYLAAERDAKLRHEYFNGYITAMAGGTPEHNQIAGNIFRKLGNQLEDRECTAYISDMRLFISSTELYTYPDIMAVCGQALFQKIEGVATLLNTILIVEVLSPTTESYDRGAKFAHYRRLPSLQEYVLVSQNKVLVECNTRRGDDWVLREFDDLSNTIQFHSIDCAIAVREIYAKVKFPDASSD
jgi:Uma2 family endonuclease